MQNVIQKNKNKNVDNCQPIIIHESFPAYFQWGPYYPFPAVNLVAVVENIESRRPFFCLPQATLTKKELFFSNYNPTFPIIDS
jgi:hypothetical protein